jgi:hypothetical protein
MSFSGTISAYKDSCAAFLRTLCNAKDMTRARDFLAEGCILVHEDLSPVQGADAFIDMWSKNLLSMPEYHKTIIDIVGELGEDKEQGAVLWVYSRISGIPSANGQWIDSVDMMKFNVDGKFVYSKDVQRAVANPDSTLRVKTVWGAQYVSTLFDDR